MWMDEHRSREDPVGATRGQQNAIAEGGHGGRRRALVVCVWMSHECACWQASSEAARSVMCDALQRSQSSGIHCLLVLALSLLLECLERLHYQPGRRAIEHENGGRAQPRLEVVEGSGCVFLACR